MNASESDERGLIMTCPKCGQRNRMVYERLGTVFRCGKCQTELPPPNEPIEVREDRIFDRLISKSPLPVLVDFWAPWCGPCKMMAPEITKVARDETSHLIVAKVNTEESPSLAAKFRIKAIPTMILFRLGLEIARQAGAMPAAAIRKFVQAQLAHSATR